MSDKELDNVFRTAFEKFAPEVSERVWERIDDELPQKNRARISPIVWKSLLAVAASFLLVFSIWLGVENAFEVKQQPVAHVRPKIATPLLQPLEGVPPANKKNTFPTVEKKLSKPVKVSNPIEVAKPIAVLENRKVAETMPQVMAVKKIVDKEYETLKLTKHFPKEDEEAYQKAILESLGDMQEETERSNRKSFLVSTVLNFVVKSVNADSSPLIRFSENENGILKVDLARRTSKK